MFNKTRSDSVLGRLSSEQQAEVYLRLKRNSYEDVQKWLALPPPEGLGIKTHKTSLLRFYHRYDKRVHFEKALAQMVGAPDPKNPMRVRLAAEAISEVGMGIASNKDCLAAFSYFDRFIHRHEQLELAREKQKLAAEELKLRAELKTLPRLRLPRLPGLGSGRAIPFPKLPGNSQPVGSQPKAPQ